MVENFKCELVEECQNTAIIVIGTRPSCGEHALKYLARKREREQREIDDLMRD